MLTQLAQCAVNAATTNIIIGGIVVSRSLKFASTAIPKTISDKINTHAQKEGAHAKIEMFDNIPVIVAGFSTNNFISPETSIKRPRSILVIVTAYIVCFVAFIFPPYKIYLVNYSKRLFLNFMGVKF
jgi:hypothetical protein